MSPSQPRTLLAFHAHPDDESSKGAGTVAKYVSQGTDAILVTATGGEAGDILNPAMDRPEVADNLKAVRAQELADAAAVIGFKAVEKLGYRDSGMPDSVDNQRDDAFCNQDRTVVLERLVRLVRRYRPDVVLGYDSHEFYPHPDHLLVHDLSLQLFEASADMRRFPESGDPWQIKKMYAPVSTKARVQTLHDVMMEQTGSSPFSVWMERLGTTEEPARKLTRIDVAGFVGQGRDALRLHKTQVDPDGFWFQVPTEVVEAEYPWEDFELLGSRVGWDEGETDLFAGI
ncbi:MAG: mycothiol conjugate amidase Mca [Acidimicrobiia bacterium]